MIHLDLPVTQINFASALKEIRTACLQDALKATVSTLSICDIDAELHDFSDQTSLNSLAAHGMRGELLFAVPCLISANPKLLGYYRLLLGYSQKSFYTAASEVGQFKSLEEKGTLSSRQKALLPELCRELNRCGKYMLDNIEPELITASFFDQLTLLTLGPQLRGGANVQRGTSAISQVFDVILEIVRPAVVSSSDRCIQVRNKSGRTVYIQFAADPDIVIREQLSPTVFKNAVAIEVKGGQDYSNIHNRIGEAEKSHQKARIDGYVECWTVVNVDRFDMTMARNESPTTNKFYRISQITTPSTEEYLDFALQIASIVGI
ncbi:MAG: XcyI family restriction endonuclease [Oscillospiraceae bacterium]|nr:XcyI family restriction endonuclease [Oscillospiraceae bacterium]